ncbi:MAG: beta-alanine-activating enzyme beta-propeller domain-containing protein [Armatimonadota bacterium]
MKRTACVGAIALAMVVCAQMAFAQLSTSCWPKFHKDYAATGQGLFGGTGSELSWAFTGSGAMRSSPIIGSGGTIYFTTNDGWIYALSGAGDVVWSANHNCVGSSTPAIAYDGTIYFGSTDNFLYALNSDGTTKWKRLLASRVNTSIAIATDGTIYFGCLNNVLYAYYTNGSQRWAYTAGGAISSSPAIATDGSIYFGCSDGKLYALTSTGTLKWKFAPTGAGTFVASPSVGPDGVIYIGSTGGYFYAVNSSGTQKWRVMAGGAVYSSAAISSVGNIYYGGRDGKLHAVSSLGISLWNFSAGLYVDSSPAVGADGGIYFASLDGTLFSVNADGTQRWSFNMGAASYSSPAIGPAGALFVGADDGKLYCFAADDTAPGAPVVTDDGAYTGYTDRLHGSWTASDPESGVSSYEYCIGTAPGASDIAAWLNAGSATQATRTGLSLADKGVYYITVRAINGAGLTGPEASSDGIMVDATAPTRPLVTDDGVYTSDNTRIRASWASADPESGLSRYEYSIGTTSGGVDTVGWTDVGLSTSIDKTGLALVDGKTYYVNVRAYNGVGLVSAVGSSDGITVDSIAPPAPAVADDGQFTSSTSSLHATWTAVTSISGVSGYEYSIGTSAGGTNVKAWTNVGLATSVTASDLTLTNGGRYYINVRALNSVGRAGAAGSSDGITVDTTPPTTPTVTDDGAWTSSSGILTANWSCSDPESGIVEYKYAVGTSAGGTDTRGWTSAGTQTSATIIGLNLVSGGRYYISVKAKNGAGVESAAGSSDGITVDQTPPTTPVVTDDGNYTIDATKLHVTWSASDPQSGVVKYEFSVGSSAGAGDIVSWTSAGTTTERTITGLSLVSGIRYYVNVRATNAANGVSAVGSSDGIYVESTPPTIPVVIDDGAFTTNTTTIHATWSAQDPETGVSSYQYSIGTAPGLADLVAWTNAALATSINRTDLVLNQGVTYYVNVKATNGIGLVSAVGSSDGLKVDTTPPDIATVTDHGEYTSDNTQLVVVLGSADAESGIVSYECAVGTTPGGTDIVGWQSAGVGPEAIIGGLAMEDGVTYYVSARATNGAGLTGPAGTSDGIKVDASGPTGLAVWDDGLFTGNETSLHGRWSAIDPESGIAGYKYCIGTVAGSNDIADWLDVGNATEATREGLSLSAGATYYITVIATNGAGGDSAPASSDGIVVDITPPSVPTVTDNGQYWGFKTSIYASWTSFDTESGVVEYQMSVGTTPGGADVAAWANVGNVTSYTRAGLHLQDGVTYYVNIKAKNGAGRWSDAGSSDGILIDSTPPTTPVVTDDGDSTLMLDRLHATWHSEDSESGIAEYMYCVGTSPGAVDVTPWTSSGVQTNVTVTGIVLEPMLTYYFSVKSRSNSGAWSAVSASDGIGFATGAAIWSKFRNAATNIGRSYFSATTVKDLAWTVPTQGYVESSAAIAADGTAYIGSGDGKVYAITQNGTIRWTCALGSSIDSSPAVASDGRIVIGCNDGYLYCLSTAGEVLWSYQTHDAIRSSPSIRENIVYVGSNDGSLYAVNLDTGLKVWSKATGAAVWSSPAVDSDGVIYVASGDTYLYAINPNGTQKWRFKTGSSADESPSIASDGTIYIGSGDGYFYAVNPNGTQKWRFDAQAVVDSSAAIATDGTIYFGTGFDGGDGQLIALNANGTKIWSVDMPNGGVYSSPALDASGRIYVGSSDGSIRCFNANGSEVWKFQTGSSVAGSPALGADSSVVFGSYDGNVYCLRDVRSKDLTPPTKPVVTVADPLLPSDQALRVSWSATDPDTMVAEYTYAVGTAPELADVQWWTSAGIETSAVIDDLLLVPGQTYYVSVKAMNPSRRWSEIGVSQGVVIVNAASSNMIGGVKELPEDSEVTIQGKVVTAVFSDCFFIEESSRASGIRCVEAGTQLQPGDMVDVTGVVKTIHGEKMLTGATHTKTGSGAVPTVIGLCGKAALSYPFCPIGMRVKTWGKVISVGDGYCLLDSGLEIRAGGLTVAKDDIIAATGVLCREQVGDQAINVVRVPANGAVTVLD